MKRSAEILLTGLATLAFAAPTVVGGVATYDSFKHLDRANHSTTHDDYLRERLEARRSIIKAAASAAVLNAEATVFAFVVSRRRTSSKTSTDSQPTS